MHRPVCTYSFCIFFNLFSSNPFNPSFHAGSGGYVCHLYQTHHIRSIRFAYSFDGKDTVWVVHLLRISGEPTDAIAGQTFYRDAVHVFGVNAHFYGFRRAEENLFGTLIGIDNCGIECDHGVLALYDIGVLIKVLYSAVLVMFLPCLMV